MKRLITTIILITALSAPLAWAAEGGMLFWEGAAHPAITAGKNPLVTVWRNSPSVSKLSLCIKNQGCTKAHGIGDGYWQARVKGYTKPGHTYYWEARYWYGGKRYVDWSETVAGRKRPKPCQACG